jgi:hypothetical protein
LAAQAAEDLAILGMEGGVAGLAAFDKKKVGAAGVENAVG